jgi:hypothetical protein
MFFEKFPTLLEVLHICFSDAPLKLHVLPTSVIAICRIGLSYHFFLSQLWQLFFFENNVAFYRLFKEQVLIKLESKFCIFRELRWRNCNFTSIILICRT